MRTRPAAALLIYRLDAAARSRLTTAYMRSLFAGGIAGSAVAAALHAANGWRPVTLFAAALASVGLLVWVLEHALHRRGGQDHAIDRWA